MSEFFLTPGHMPIMLVTPERYMALMYKASGRNQYLWPMYFAMRTASMAFVDIMKREAVRATYQKIADAKDGYIQYGWDVALAFRDYPKRGRVDKLYEFLQDTINLQVNNIQSGVALGVGSSLAQYVESISHAGQLSYAYKTLQFHTAITPRMRRYWNYHFYPNWPDMMTAFLMHRRARVPGFNLSEWTKAEVIEAGRMDGWSVDHANDLYQSMEHIPSPREAFYWWVKGHVTPSERDAFYYAHGWPERYHAIMTDNWRYNPSLYDLTRIADTMGLPQTWTLKKLKRIGLDDEDRARMWNMLKVRPIRDEQRAITTVWVWRYKYGRCSYDELSSALTDLGVSAPEIELLLEKAQLDYEDELINEWVDILMWRFRNMLITEAEYLAGLENLGIRHEKANLMVEEQKAMGYMGGYY